MQAEYLKLQEPLVAEERADMWVAKGTACPALPPNPCPGRPIEVYIAKNDGRVLRVFGSQQ
jgi:hypothetical protein